MVNALLLDTEGMHIRLKRNSCIIYCVIIWLIYGPLCLYGIIKYYLSRNELLIKKRHSIITLYFLICLFLLLIIFLPIIIIIYCSSKRFLNIDQGLPDDYKIYLFYAMVVVLLQTLYIFVWRQFLYYFDISFTQYTSHQEWTQFINPMNFGTHSFLIDTKNRQNQSINALTYSIKLFYKVMILLFIITSISIFIWLSPMLHLTADIASWLYVNCCLLVYSLIHIFNHFTTQNANF